MINYHKIRNYHNIHKYSVTEANDHPMTCIIDQNEFLKLILQWTGKAADVKQPTECVLWNNWNVVFKESSADPELASIDDHMNVLKQNVDMDKADASTIGSSDDEDMDNAVSRKNRELITASQLNTQVTTDPKNYWLSNTLISWLYNIQNDQTRSDLYKRVKLVTCETLMYTVKIDWEKVDKQEESAKTTGKGYCLHFVVKIFNEAMKINKEVYREEQEGKIESQKQTWWKDYDGLWFTINDNPTGAVNKDTNKDIQQRGVGRHWVASSIKQDYDEHWLVYDSFNNENIIEKNGSTYGFDKTFESVRKYFEHLYNVVVKFSIKIPKKPRLIKYDAQQTNSSDCGIYCGLSLLWFHQQIEKMSGNWNESVVKKITVASRHQHINSLRTELTKCITNQYNTLNTSYLIDQCPFKVGECYCASIKNQDNIDFNEPTDIFQRDYCIRIADVVMENENEFMLQFDNVTVNSDYTIQDF